MIETDHTDTTEVFREKSSLASGAINSTTSRPLPATLLLHIGALTGMG